MYAVGAAIVLITVYQGVMSSDLMGYVIVCLTFSLLLHKIGKHLPIWNTYVGGGLLMIFFGTAVLK